MIGSLRSPLHSFLSSASTAPFASSSRHVLTPLLRSSAAPVQQQQVRFRTVLAPRRTKHKKSMKGLPISLPIGGSIKGTTLTRGTFGIRLLASTRLSAAQLTACREAIKRKIKPVKGAEVFLRVFPDTPVCVKGNEVRMGKGKGSFEFWACRVPMGRVIFELGGGGIREEIAKQALRLAQVKLPVPSEFITTSTPPRLGNIVSHDLQKPASTRPLPLSSSETIESKNRTPTAKAALLDLQTKNVEEIALALDELKLSSTPEAAAAQPSV